jgi:hypothetical protein
MARWYDVAPSLIYRWHQQGLSAVGDGTSFAPAVVVDDPGRSAGKSSSEAEAPISVESFEGTCVRIGASAPLVTATLRALR